jgi:hypothetical protein
MNVDAFFRIVLIGLVIAVFHPGAAAGQATTQSPTTTPAEPAPPSTPPLLSGSARFGAGGSPASRAATGSEQGPVVISNETLPALASHGRLSFAPMVDSPMPALPTPRKIEKVQADRDRWRRKAEAQRKRVDDLERNLQRADRDVEVLQKSSNETSRRSLEQAQAKRRVLADQVARARAELQTMLHRSRE